MAQADSGGEDRLGDVLDRIKSRRAVVGVVGLGYVGLPLAAAAARSGFKTIGFDNDSDKPRRLNRGESYIDAVSGGEIIRLAQSGQLIATSDFDRLGECDVITICVPTPLTRHREPDLSYIEATALTISERLRPGQLIVLESTTFPGTTDDVLRPILEQTGLVSSKDFFLAYSPEREDPGRQDFSTVTTPKIVAGDGPAAASLVEAFYGAIVSQVVPVSTTRAAEAVKLTENIFRAVNIALVNELKVVYGEMGVDIWEVIDAAATKPFGYMPFYPGPGLGGHCIPIDPFYLSWKAREYDLTTRFIELAGEVNLAMPHYVVTRLERALDQNLSRSLGVSSVLVVGLAYKKNVSDIRESPSLKIIQMIEGRGASVKFHDPHVSRIPKTRRYSELNGMASVGLLPETVAAFDAVIIATDHDAVDYAMIAENARLIVDARNAMRRRDLVPAGHLVLA